MLLTPAVGVAPQSAFSSRPRLWQALESAYDVCFRALGSDGHSGSGSGSGGGGGGVGGQVGVNRLDGLSAVIVLAGRDAGGREVPLEHAAVSLLRFLDEEPREDAPGEVRMGGSASLDERFHGRSLRELRCAELEAVPDAGAGRVLASVDGRAVWTAAHEGRDERWRQTASMMPLELGPQEVLRDRFGGERFLALLPILELLRQVQPASAGERWRQPPLRASIILDDPNLHWRSYGFADFTRLADTAERERFHVSIAAVPLDMWFSHPAAASLFRRRESLSLLVHGNDHLHGELARDLPPAELLRVAAQAQRRVARLERRTGLRVARVMAPPHGECSDEMLAALRRAGFDAACISRPYPWLERPPAHALTAQWALADVRPERVPVISRHPFAGLAQDIVLRAYLDQPLVLYGHHWDLAAGLDPLRELAALVNSLGEVRWMGLGGIAAGNYSTRTARRVQQVRMFTRHAQVELDDGVDAVLVQRDDERDMLEISRGAAAPRQVRLGEPAAVPSGEGPLSLRMRACDEIDISRTPAPRRSAWAPLRRMLVEGRDRAHPLTARARRRARIR